MRIGQIKYWQAILLIFGGALALFIALLVFRDKNNFSLSYSENHLSSIQSPVSSCKIKKRIEIVNGNSMSPFIKNGEKVVALFGYYQCYSIERGDVVALHYSGDKNPLIKFIKGLPGDRLYLKQANGGWHIVVNGKTLKNSEGSPYLIFGKGYKMLSLYEKGYKGVIPPHSYLVLGNSPAGSLDSTRFGLIDKSDILAKVVKQ